MKPGLQLNTSQHLTLSPQLQQAIRLLQLSQSELKLSIENAVAQNPLLEIVDPFNAEPLPAETDLNHAFEPSSLNDLINDKPADFQAPTEHDLGQSEQTILTMDDLRWDQLPVGDNLADSLPGEESSLSIKMQVDHTLHDHLLWQLDMARVSPIDYLIATFIIDAIDDSGFLTLSLEDIQHTLNTDTTTTVELDEVAAVLQRIQHFDPAGIAARNVQESLLLQLKQFTTDTPYLTEAIQLIQHHLNTLDKQHHEELRKKTGWTSETLNGALSLIRSLQPRPGQDFSSVRTDYVIPDIIVSKRDQQWIAALNQEAVPQIRINNAYHHAGTITDKHSTDFIAQHLQEARWFLNSLQHRHTTLLRVAHEIVNHQQAFFEQGPVAMQPLRLQTLANSLNLHESTISRVTTQKFLFCHRGVFELKYFFSSHLATSTGTSCSSTAIKALLKKMLDNEDRRAPLSDNALVQSFQKQGIQIARRTITKYREELGVASSVERKQE